MRGITFNVRIAPPVKSRSTTFIANSIEIIEISDMPIAVLNACLNFICWLKMNVSSAIEVIRPLKIAKVRIANEFQ